MDMSTFSHQPYAQTYTAEAETTTGFGVASRIQPPAPIAHGAPTGDCPCLDCTSPNLSYQPPSAEYSTHPSSEGSTPPPSEFCIADVYAPSTPLANQYSTSFAPVTPSAVLPTSPMTDIMSPYGPCEPQMGFDPAQVAWQQQQQHQQLQELQMQMQWNQMVMANAMANQASLVQNPQQQTQQTQQQQQGRRGLDRVPTVVTYDKLQDVCGRMVEIARTPNGSSFLQAALREKNPSAHEQIWTELHPAMADLLLDAHACYVVKTLIEQMPHGQLMDTVTEIGQDKQLLFSLCTHTLHSRRIVQFFLELLSTEESRFIAQMMVDCTREVAMTQQGCIAMQRTLDNCDAAMKEVIFKSIYSQLLDFAKDPFANYVVQYVLETCEKQAMSEEILKAFGGHVVELACNKFASNVIEKTLLWVTPEAQHTMILEMYDAPEDVLHKMLQDSFGNYIIQSSIAVAPFRDVWFISERLAPVLQHVPYGYKIEARLTRRLKGKSTTQTSTKMTSAK